MSHKLVYRLERSFNGNMNVFKVENHRYSEMKLGADPLFKGWEKDRQPKGDVPKIFHKRKISLRKKTF